MLGVLATSRGMRRGRFLYHRYLAREVKDPRSGQWTKRPRASELNSQRIEACLRQD